MPVFKIPDKPVVQNKPPKIVNRTPTKEVSKSSTPVNVPKVKQRKQQRGFKPTSTTKPADKKPDIKIDEVRSEPVELPVAKEETKVAEEVLESKAQETTNDTPLTFKPIKRGDVSRMVKEEISSKKTKNGKFYKIDEDGLNTIVNTIVDSLSENFVRKSDVEELVIKTLQKMAVSGVSRK